MDQRKPTLSEYAARRLRAHLGAERISVAALARRLGWTQSYLARRVDGRVSFDLDDLERVANELGIEVVDLLPATTAGNTLRNRQPAKKTRSAPRSTVRTPHSTTRPTTRPGKTNPRTDTRRPAMIPRPLHA